ncbi:hypothetical protein B0H14DRAFT_3146562 [Mycena olivaceomarginata]|nr:hypothetical protein B0H14DRAFT_3146562 [Mycena olivaceomarginata]
MYGLSKKLLVFMACAVMITVGVSVWALVPAGLIGAWGAQLAGDVIAISLILYRAYTHGQGTSVLRRSLWGVLIRDGIAYFLMISLANIANLIVFYFGDIYTSTTLTWFTSAVSVTMILRLMINLHLAAAPERTDFGGTSSNPIHFNICLHYWGEAFLRGNIVKLRDLVHHPCWNHPIRTRWASGPSPHRIIVVQNGGVA